MGVPRGRVKGPGRVLRGRVKGPGRVLRRRVEAPWLGWVDVTKKRGKVFSFCARLGAQLPWAGRAGSPLGGCPYGQSRAKAEGQGREAGVSGCECGSS